MLLHAERMRRGWTIRQLAERAETSNASISKLEGIFGHSIAGAFLATLYGVGSANLVFLPVSNKLKELSAEEVLYG